MSQTLFWNLLAKKLSKQATPAELDTLQALMKKHPEWLSSVEHLMDVWELEQDKKKDTNAARQAFENHTRKLNNLGILLTETEPEPLPLENKTAVNKKALALCFVAFIFLILLIAKPRGNADEAKKPEPITISTVSNVGKKSKLVLPDSTIVWLNKGSSLTYDPAFGKQSRTVTLKGEAFFDVRHNAVPFLIHTKSVVIKVLGTAFNVRSYDNEAATETVLVRGKVEVSINGRPGERLYLKPNEKLIVKNEKLVAGSETKNQQKEPLIFLSQLTKLPDSSIIETTWKEESLVFTNESFEELVQRMQRWYNITIVIENSSLKNERFTGVFKNETPEQALAALQLTAPFQFIKNNTGFRITK